MQLIEKSCVEINLKGCGNGDLITQTCVTRGSTQKFFRFETQLFIGLADNIEFFFVL